jgi:hypothetical protein
MTAFTGYKEYSNLDIEGGDITKLFSTEAPPDNLMYFKTECDKDSKCVAFNSNGMLKSIKEPTMPVQNVSLWIKDLIPVTTTMVSLANGEEQQMLKELPMQTTQIQTLLPADAEQVMKSTTEANGEEIKTMLPTMTTTAETQTEAEAEAEVDDTEFKTRRRRFGNRRRDINVVVVEENDSHWYTSYWFLGSLISSCCIIMLIIIAVVAYVMMKKSKTKY